MASLHVSRVGVLGPGGPVGTWSTQIRVRICVPAYAGRLSLFSRPDMLILYDAIASTKSSVGVDFVRVSSLSSICSQLCVL
jgi:hypothetical protein